MINKMLLITILFVSSLAISDSLILPKQEYIDEITKKIYSEWRIIKASSGWTCEVNITQDEDGNILDSNISHCNTKDKRFISQLQKAIDKSSPLPKPPEGLFTRNVTIYPKVKGDIDLLKSIKRLHEAGDPKVIEWIRASKRYLHRKKYNEDLLGQLKQMNKDGNLIAIETIENIKNNINVVESIKKQ